MECLYRCLHAPHLVTTVGNEADELERRNAWILETAMVTKNWQGKFLPEPGPPLLHKLVGESRSPDSVGHLCSGL